MTARGAGPRTAKLFEGLGYIGDQQFNGLNGHRRLLFYDNENERRIDVFVGRFEMCHAWPLEQRLEVVRYTLPLWDLLLKKLQIFALTEKDQRDIPTVFAGIGAILTSVFLYWASFHYPFFGPQAKQNIVYWVGGAVVFGLFWHVGARVLRRDEGIDIDRVYAEIPPE